MLNYALHYTDSMMIRLVYNVRNKLRFQGIPSGLLGTEICFAQWIEAIDNFVPSYRSYHTMLLSILSVIIGCTLLRLYFDKWQKKK